MASAVAASSSSPHDLAFSNASLPTTEPRAFVNVKEPDADICWTKVATLGSIGRGLNFSVLPVVEEIGGGGA